MELKNKRIEKQRENVINKRINLGGFIIDFF